MKISSYVYNMDPLTVLITGTNKGLGCDLVKIFYKLSPKALIIATSRSKPEMAYQRWEALDNDKRIICKQLDLTSV
jgi:short-subunit dehydrogenase involved in D-alanine esterification of teichoic acids